MNRKAMLLSFLSGFLSLSLEVIWIRLFGFFSGGLPQIFAFTLALFLIGIAFGSLYGRKLCERYLESQELVNQVGLYILFAAFADILMLSLLICFPNYAVIIFILGIIVCAGLRGVIFPVVHHLGAGCSKTGASISNVYFSNVLGSTMAPIFVGFILLEYFSTQQTYLWIIFLSFIVATFCLTNKKYKFFVSTLSLIMLFLQGVPEKLIHNLSNRDKEGLELEHVIENKHGIIQEYKDKEGDHKVYGGNVYDGKLNTSLLHNINNIHRAYLPLVIAPNTTKKVLVIGLSTGSWAKVLTLLPNLEEMTIVELNPGYLKFAELSADMRELLNDPKVHIVTDDGRRYLNKNPEQKWDLIVINMTFYFRNQSSSILSKDFLEIAKKHLNPDGMMLYNTTGFIHSYYTAHKVFPYVYQYYNNALVSLKPIPQLDRGMIEQLFSELKWRNGKKLFLNNDEITRAASTMVNEPLLPYERIKFQDVASLEVITDDNMINEYKYGKY